MSRKGIRVHFDRRPGGNGNVTCRDGFLLLKVWNETKKEWETTLLADQSSPCPLCNATAAANMAGWKAILSLMTPPLLDDVRHVMVKPEVVTRVNRSDADLHEIDTTGFHVTKVPEGVVPRRNREGGFVRKGGNVVMDTIDFRSDEAVARRMAGGMSKWGKGVVTGSTSVCSTWAVPARPNSDAMANSSEVLKDLRSAETERCRQNQKDTPRKGRHVKPKTTVVRRHMA